MDTKKDSIQLVEHQLALLLRRVESTRKQSTQLDRSSYLLLDALATHGPLSISALAQLFQLDISTLSRQTAPLESSGWVERLPDQEDGRVKILQLTPSGQTQLQHSRDIRYNIYAQLLQDWTEDDRRTFGLLLNRFNQAIREHPNLSSTIPIPDPETPTEQLTT
ncbi:MAG: MarR family transcriptional regulator [Chloroflexia bacterium]